MNRIAANIHLSRHEYNDSIDQLLGRLRACVEAARSNPNTTSEQWTTLRAQWQQLKDAIGD